MTDSGRVNLARVQLVMKGRYYFFDIITMYYIIVVNKSVISVYDEFVICNYLCSDLGEVEDEIFKKRRDDDVSFRRLHMRFTYIVTVWESVLFIVEIMKCAIKHNLFETCV